MDLAEPELAKLQLKNSASPIKRSRSNCKKLLLKLEQVV
jgi:hypothetical protein